MLSDNTVQAYYEATVEQEWARLERHKMEFATTWRAMQESIPAGSAILDVGGGPGRYSIFLSRAGHQVTLLDLSPGNVAFARAKAAELGAELCGYVEGDALDLSRFEEASFDVVLLMGPLYHLVRESDRERALRESLRVLSPGGLLIAGFIARFAFLITRLRTDPSDISYVSNMHQLLADGVNIVDGENRGFPNAFFVHPADIAPWMSRFGLTQLRLAAAEPFVAAAEPAVNALDDESFDRWADVCYRMGTDPVTWGSAEHMLYVGRRP